MVMKRPLTFSVMLCLITAGPLGAQYAETGYAVYYADYLIGRQTAYGEVYNPHFFTCAHKRHPLGTLLKVTRIDDGRSVLVRVNDKGPFKEGYVVDLSKVAGRYLGLDVDGKARVRVEVVGYSETNPVPEGYQPPRDITTARGISQPSAYGNRPDEYGASSLASGTASGEIPRLEAGPGGFGIQVASYTLEENAVRQARALQAQDVKNLYIQESATSYSGTMYRLIIGRFRTRDQAEQALQFLRRQKGVNGFVTMLK